MMKVGDMEIVRGDDDMFGCGLCLKRYNGAYSLQVCLRYMFCVICLTLRLTAPLRGCTRRAHWASTCCWVSLSGHFIGSAGRCTSYSTSAPLSRTGAFHLQVASDVWRSIVVLAPASAFSLACTYTRLSCSPHFERPGVTAIFWCAIRNTSDDDSKAHLEGCTASRSQAISISPVASRYSYGFSATDFVRTTIAPALRRIR